MRSMRRGGRRRASLGGLFSDIMDATHDYSDDWIDRFDDFEYDMRDAADDMIDDRDYYYDRPSRGYDGPSRGYDGPSRRHDGPYDRPPIRRALPEGGRQEAVKKVLNDAGLKELAAKVEALAKTVDKLAKAKGA